VLSRLDGPKHDRVVLGRGSGYSHCTDIVASQQLVKIIDESCTQSIRCWATARRVVIPDSNKVGVRVLLDPRGVLGSMHVPESKNRNLDRIRHKQSFRAWMMPSLSLGAPP
jgi:hypothetical protein